MYIVKFYDHHENKTKHRTFRTQEEGRTEVDHLTNVGYTSTLHAITYESNPIYSGPPKEKWVKRWIHITSPSPSDGGNDVVTSTLSSNTSPFQKHTLNSQEIEIEVNTGKVRLV